MLGYGKYGSLLSATNIIRRLSTKLEEELPRITMPQKFVKRLNKVLEKQGDDPMNYEAFTPNRQKRGRLVIQCSNNKKNHYENTVYRNANENILYSSGWKQAKRVGERFTILPTDTKPFFGLTTDSSLKFDNLGLDPRVVAATRTQFAALRKPTTIQAQAIPEIQGYANVLMAAESGAGKTLAYLLPIISDLLRERELFGLHQSQQVANQSSTHDSETAHPSGQFLFDAACLIVVPSRELCMQLDSVLRRLCASLPVTFIALRNARDIALHLAASADSNGSQSVLNSMQIHRNHPSKAAAGVSSTTQPHKIDILVCTPHIATQLAQANEAEADSTSEKKTTPRVNFKCLRWLVLDEADTLLDESFSSTIAEFVTKARLELQCELPNEEDDEDLKPVERVVESDKQASQNRSKPNKFANYYIDEADSEEPVSKSKSDVQSESIKRDGPVGTQLILSCATLPALFGSRKSDFQSSLKRSRRFDEEQTSENNDKVSESILRHFIPVDSCVRLTTSNVHRLQTHVRHTFIRVRKSERATQLSTMLNEAVASNQRCVVFANQTRTAHQLHRYLAENGLLGGLLAGKQRDEGRDSALRRFLSGESLFLVCSDLASRGIDMRCDRVLNFELPFTMSDYLHRAGRAGRLNADQQANYDSQSRRRAAENGNTPECISLVATKWEIRRVQQIEMSVRRGQPLGADLLASLDRHTLHDDSDVEDDLESGHSD